MGKQGECTAGGLRSPKARVSASQGRMGSSKRSMFSALGKLSLSYCCET